MDETPWAGAMDSSLSQELNGKSGALRTGMPLANSGSSGQSCDSGGGGGIGGRAC